MRISKKVFNILLSFILMMSFIPGSAYAASSSDVDANSAQDSQTQINEDETYRSDDNSTSANTNDNSISTQDDTDDFGSSSGEQSKQDTNILNQQAQQNAITEALTSSQNSNANEGVNKGNTQDPTQENEPQKTIEDGIYTISLAGNSDMALDVAGGSLAGGANIQIYNSNSSAAQKFKFVCDESGFYTITNFKSDMALDAAYAGQESGTNVWQWTSNNSDAQKWAVLQNDDNSYSIINKANGLKLDALGTSKGSNVELWNDDSARLQSFDLTPAILERTVQDGTYYISSAINRGQVFDVKSGSLSDGAGIQAYGSNMTKAQKFNFAYNEESGYYTITNVGSNKVLDATGAIFSKGTKIQQWKSNNTLAQKWEVATNGHGYTIKSAADSSLVFDLAGGSSDSGTQVQLWSSNNTAAQKFYLVKDEQREVSAGSDLSLNDWYEIVPTVATKTCFDIALGSKDSGAITRLWNKNQTMAQLYKLDYKDGYYRIICQNSNKALELKNGSIVPGIGTQQVDQADSLAQQFRIDVNEDGTYTFTCAANGLQLAINSLNSGTNILGELEGDTSVSNKFILVKRDYVLPENLVEISPSYDTSKDLDLSGGADWSGANIQLWNSNGTLAQKWQTRQVSGESDVYRFESACSGKYMAVSGTNVCQLNYDSNSQAQKWKLVGIDAGACTFMNLETNTVLDVHGAQSDNGTNIQTYKSNGSAAQKFVIKSTGYVQTGMFVFHSKSNYNKVMDVAGGSKDDCAKIQAYDFNDSGAQKWSIVSNDDGTYRIVNAASDKVLDVYCGSAYNGAPIQQYSWNGSNAQKWYPTYQRGGGISFESALNRNFVLAFNASDPWNGCSLLLAQKDGTTSQNFLFEQTTYVPPIPAEMQTMIDRMYWEDSGTEWAIGVDRAANKVGVFNGYAGHWSLVYWWSCACGAPWSPTITGTYWTTGYKKPVLSTDSRAVHCTQIDGEYFFHSILESEDELGQSVSHGCVRMHWNDAWWIYTNINAGTKVVIYN